MNAINNTMDELYNNIKYGVKWISISLVLGSICGLIGTAFHYAIDYVTELREANDILIWMMPLGGILIVFLYHEYHYIISNVRILHFLLSLHLYNNPHKLHNEKMIP